MKRGKLFALLLALVMAFSAAVPAFAADAFADVPEDAYYAEAVAWAADKGIAYGRDGGFEPEAAVTRAEAAAFLWRMAGRPDPARAETFADVEGDPDNEWYRDAVQWAAEQGVTNGTGGGNFSPAAACTRGMILTMLYRMEGSPFDAAMEAALPEDGAAMTLEDLGNAIIQGIVAGVRAEDALADVKEGDYFELPVIWAMFNGILGEDQIDVEARTVRPDAPCPRGEMVYFLFAASKYEEAAAAAEEANKPLDPIQTGTVPETVALDKNGVKITVTGIDNTSSAYDVWLDLTVENGSDKELEIDAGELYVNTFAVSPSTFIPVAEEWGTSFKSVVVPAGKTVDFNVGLNDLREKGITAVYEIELTMGAYTRAGTGDDWEYEDFAAGGPVNIRTSLYDKNVSYDMEGTAVYDRDGLKVVVCKAENNEYMGPQISVYAYNSGKEDACLELAELKLDGEAADAYFSLYVPAGKRAVDTVSIDIDYENIPVVREAELTLQTVDTENWEPVETFAPVKVAFTV